MTNRVQTLRSAVTNTMPPAGVRQPGELWTNFADFQLGVIDTSLNPQKLLGVRYFQTTGTYAVNDFVVNNGILYVAKQSVAPGAFNIAQWSPVGGTIVTSDTPPPGSPGVLWWDSTGGELYVYYNDGNSSQWVSAVNLGGALAAAYLPLSGGSLTGNLTITAPGVNPPAYQGALVVNSAPGISITDGTHPAIAQQYVSTYYYECDFYATPSSPWTGFWFQYTNGGTDETGGVQLGVGSTAGINQLFLQNGNTITGTSSRMTINGASSALTVNAATSINGSVYTNSSLQTAGQIICGSSASFAGNVGVTGGSSVLCYGGGFYPNYGTNTTCYLGGGSSNTVWYFNGSNYILTQANQIQFVSAGATAYSMNGGFQSSAGLNFNNGWSCRTGINGSNQGNHFNMDWGATQSGAVGLWLDTIQCGYIQTSDYRIKKDIKPLPSMWDRVKALNPISYTHKEYSPPSHTEKEPFSKNDDREHWGFVAHELQETLTPAAASGEKDQEDCLQSPNWLAVVASLTKALQEAMQRIEVLEAKVGAV